MMRWRTAATAMRTACLGAVAVTGCLGLVAPASAARLDSPGGSSLPAHAAASSSAVKVAVPREALAGGLAYASGRVNRAGLPFVLVGHRDFELARRAD